MNEEENILEGAGQENAVGSPRTETEQAKAETTGAAAGGSAEEESGNRKMAAARRSGREEANRDFDREISGYGLLDGTGKPVTNREELRAYLKSAGDTQLAARAKAAGKTVDEQRTEETERARGREQLRQEQETADRNARAAADIAELREAYPRLDAGKLLKDERFLLFAGDRLGRKNLVELYEDYNELVDNGKKAENREDKNSRSTGSGSGGENSGALSSREERDRQEWNRRYPKAKLSAKEWSEWSHEK